MGGSLGLPCAFSRDVLTSWTYVGFLDVWGIHFSRYPFFPRQAHCTLDTKHERISLLKQCTVCGYVSWVCWTNPRFFQVSLKWNKHGMFSKQCLFFKRKRDLLAQCNQLAAVSLADQRSELRGQYSSAYSNCRVCKGSCPIIVTMDGQG